MPKISVRFALFLTASMMRVLLAQNSPRLDILQARNAGVIRSTAAPTFDIGSLDDIFDGDPTTLARTAAINPAVRTIEFRTQFTIDRSRLLMSSGDGEWTLEVADTLPDLENKAGSYQLLFKSCPTRMDVWDDATFSAAAGSFA